MPADPDQRGRRDQVALVVAPGRAGSGPGPRPSSRPTSAGSTTAARREVVALGGLDVQRVEGRQVLRGALRHHDAGLVGLLDVAPPQLVHALEQVVLGCGRRAAPGTRTAAGPRRSRPRTTAAASPRAQRGRARHRPRRPARRAARRRAGRGASSAIASLTVAAASAGRRPADPSGRRTRRRLQVRRHRVQPRREVAVRPSRGPAPRAGRRGTSSPSAPAGRAPARLRPASSPRTSRGLAPPLLLHRGPGGHLQEARAMPASGGRRGGRRR